MYEPRSGINIPRFTIPGVKDLEDALNSLSDAIQETAAKTKSFESSSSVRVIDSGGSLTFELLDNGVEYAPGRFEIFYDRYSSRVYVYEGRVSVNINGVDTVVVPTIDKVKILLPTSPGFKDLNIDRPASFDVKTKIPPTDDSNTAVFKVYLKVLMSAEDEADRFSLIFHDYSNQGHPSETIDADLYFEIGEIFKTDKKIYINQKWSSDITLPALSNCTFQVTDVTEYPKEKQNPDDPDEPWPQPSDFKIRIRNAKVLDRYPDGMDKDTVYKIDIDEELMTKDQFYVYAKVMLDEYGVVHKYDKAVTIEVSQYWLASGSCIQRIPIARVSAYKTESGGESSEKYKLDIENYCPLIEIKQPNDCAFEVEDATDSTTEVKIQVKRTNVDGKYPEGMQDPDLPYQIVLPTESQWFAVYVVIELDSDGNIAQGENPITIGVYDEYKTNEPLVQYSLVSEVNISIREDETRYISFIKNLCAEVTVNKAQDCPFELYDASDYDDEGVAENAKVYVTNTSVFEGRYPEGMDSDSRYVVQITQEDIKIGGILPGIGICYIYLKVLVDEFGAVQEYESAITIEKTSRWYPDRGCSVQRFLIGSVQVDSSNSSANPGFLSLASMCPIISLNRDACCPFFVEDSSEDDKLKVQIRTGKIAGKYPAGMLEKGVYVLELPKEENFHLIYCVSVLTADGYLYPDRVDGDDYVSFTIEKDYVANTENLQYDLIAIVNTNFFEIISIQNSCYEPVYKKPEPCAFALYDASDYENTGSEEEPKWEATNCKVLVTQSSIRGLYPTGMSGDPDALPYVLTFNGSDFEQWGEASIERCYVYLLVIVNNKGEILEQENSVTIEKSPHWYDSDNSLYQRILVGWVDANIDGGATMYSVHSDCPNLSLKKPADCRFKIEDASDLSPEGEKKVVIRNGKINGRYPEGMDDDTIYEISLPETTVGEYYVFAVISIDENGQVLDGVDGGPEISFSIEKEYKQNTGTEYYSVIGTIYLNELGQLTIQSYCLDPSLPDKNLCPFELYDASDYDEQGNATNAKVLVSNYSVFGGRYADGMDAESRFVLAIEPEDTKIGNVVPGIGICYIYLEVLVDEYGEVLPDDTAITISKTSAWYQQRGCCIQRFMIGSVQVANEGGTSKFLSVGPTCPVIALNKDACCPFLVEDASDMEGLKVQIRTGTIAGKYPAGMAERSRYVLELPQGESFHLIYCVSVLTADGYLYPDRVDGDDYVSFTIEKDYVTNTENLQYDLIAIVNTNPFEIVSIQNSCYEPLYKQKSGCDFALYDASDYESTGTEEEPKWEATNCKVLVTQSSIRGVYPTGMSGDPDALPYVLTLTSADFTSWEGSDGLQRCYVYLQVLVDDDDNIYGEENSVTIETSPFWSRNDNHTYQRILIGWIEANSSSGGPTMVSVQSACPDLVLNKKTNCPFKLEDASQLTIAGTKEVMITNGKINDRYPFGMGYNTIYTLGVPALSGENSNNIFYVYAVISIDQYGRALPGQDGGGEISFSLEQEYKYSTADTYYAVIGTVEYDADNQLILTSYCIDPSISNSLESCGFKTTDASTWENDSSAPSTLAVRIQSSKIDGKYPEGMGNDTDFVLELNASEDFNAEGVCYIYAKAVLNPSGRIPDNSQELPLTIEKVSKYQPKGNFIQHIPIAHVYIAPVSGGMEIVKITNFCPTGQLNEIDTCAFFTEDVTDYSDTSRTKLSVLVANRKVHGELPSNMSSQQCFVWDFDIDSNVEVYYVCCRIPTDLYGVYNEAAAGQDNIEISVQKQEPKSTSFYQWFVLATIYVDTYNQYIWDIQNYCYVPEAKPRNCFFEVTDACSYDLNFKPSGALRVEVDQWSLPNTESASNPNGIFPTGMGNDFRYQLTLPDDVEWCGIFLNIQVDQQNEILTGNNAVTLSVENYFPEGTSTYQVFYLAGINIEQDGNGDRYISYIDNQCAYVAVKAPPTCPFLIEDATDANNCKIQIRSGRIANYWPTNMNGTDTYTLIVPDDQSWWAVYCGMVVADGVIQTGQGQVTFYLSDKYLTNTETFVNFKIGEIQTYLDSNNDKYVGWIDNVCAVPFVSGGSSLPCPFKVVDVSTESAMKVMIAWGLIWNMLPTGMYPTDDPQLVMDISQTSFIYSKIDFDLNTLLVTSVSFAVHTELQTNTSSTQYNLVATVIVGKVTVEGTEKDVITGIRNICMQPFPSPCSLT